MAFGRVLKNCLKFVARPLFSAGKVIASAGQTIFGVTGAVAYIFGIAEACVLYNPWFMAAAVGFMCADIFINCVTRVPAIYQGLKSTPAEPSTLEEPVEVDDFEYTIGFNRHFAGQFFYVFTASLGIVSSLFASLAAFLGSTKLTDLGDQFHQPDCTKAGSDDNFSDLVKTIITVYGAIVAVSNLASFFSFNLKKVFKNAKKLRDRIAGIHDTDENKPLNKVAFALAAFISFFNLLGTVGASFRGTTRVFTDKLPRFTDDEGVQTIAGVSTSSTISTFLTTQPFSLYGFFDQVMAGHYKTTEEIAYKHTCLLNTTKAVGAFSSLGIGLTSLAGIATLLSTVFTVSPYAWWVITLGSISAVTTTAFNYAFNIHEGCDDYLEMQQKKLITYDAVNVKPPKMRRAASAPVSEVRIDVQANDYQQIPGQEPTVVSDSDRSINDPRSAQTVVVRGRHSPRFFRTAPGAPLAIKPKIEKKAAPLVTAQGSPTPARKIVLRTPSPARSPVPNRNRYMRSGMSSQLPDLAMRLTGPGVAGADVGRPNTEGSITRKITGVF